MPIYVCSRLAGSIYSTRGPPLPKRADFARISADSRTALAIFLQNLFAAEVGVSPVMAAPGSLLTRGRKTVLVGS